MRRIGVIGLLVAALAVSGGKVLAAVPVLSIDVGTLYLEPDLAGQVVELSLSNDGSGVAQVQGLSLRLE
ncbi:MAG: hypothetical protein KDM81_16220, partial [Verrucomicrobiae bacterium]|nr:hypothetical protein [Verrucomicrobiae bacterium]